MDSKGGRHRRVESLGTTNHTNKSVVSIEEDLHSRSQNNTASYQPWRQVVRGDSTYSKVMGSQYSDYSDTYAPTVTSFSYSERGSSHSGLRSEEWGADVQFSDYSEHDDSEFPSACELAQTHAASEGLTLEGLREVISESLVDGPNRSKRLNLPAEVQKIIEEDAKYFFGTASVDSHGTEETALDSSRATVEGSDASGALPDPVEEYDHGGDDARSGEPLDKKREPKYEAFDSVGAKWKSWFLGNDFPIDATPEEKLDLYFRKRAVAWKPMKQFEANSFASGSGSRIPVPQLEVSTGSLEQRNSRPRQIERGGTPPRLPLHGIATPLGNEELQSRSNTEARGGAEEKNAAVETGSEIMLEVDRRSVKEGG
eukprot:Colp12_sorted_trinity150504_noHs@28211